ncbi:vesicle transport through interaction with t-SNAREs homolog 1B [Hyperolius riggenbachi]|uniref:vesicle transport through interaction with t-SNAREs homolog 1B n=1 Tax=Hyperolius riggenbachi TaxID=752182 RepID=UPI0035A2E4D4
MSSERFEAIHELFRVHLEDLPRLLEKLKSRYGEEKKKLLQEFEERRFEADEMLTQMEKELKRAPPSFQNEMMSKLRAYRRDLAKLQNEGRNSHQFSGLGHENSRRGPNSAGSEYNNPVQTQRTLLLQGNESLNRATDSIARAHHIAAETDAIGRDIVEELDGQREQLERTKDRLINTGENLGRSRKILRNMSRKIVTNKFLLIIIIILELAILGGLVYYKFFRKT